MSEQTAVQNPMIQYAGQIGWQPVSRRQALQWRGGESGLFFSDILCQQLVALNPDVVDDTAANEILRQLNLLPATIEGNQAALEWLRGQQSIFDPAEKRERNVRLIDFDDFNNNQFHVTDEWRQKNPRFANRADVVFLINGLPVATCETKNAGKKDGLAEGVGQIRLRDMQTKWASISTNGRLTLNRELVDLPRPLGEYVIVHELTHLLAPNHGKVFKSFMAAYLPDWQERERALRDFERL